MKIKLEIGQIVNGVIALIYVVASFLLFQTLINGSIKPEFKDMSLYIAGAVTSGLTIILSYFFGSSQGSAKKDEMLRQKKETDTDPKQ